MLARESAATMTPSLNMKASVVVPFAGFTNCIASFWKPSNWNRSGKGKHQLVFSLYDSSIMWFGNKRNETKTPLLLTSVVTGTSKDGAAANPSISSLLDPKDGAVDSRPLVSSFIFQFTAKDWSSNPTISPSKTNLRFELQIYNCNNTKGSIESYTCKEKMKIHVKSQLELVPEHSKTNRKKTQQEVKAKFALIQRRWILCFVFFCFQKIVWK